MSLALWPAVPRIGWQGGQPGLPPDLRQPRCARGLKAIPALFHPTAGSALRQLRVIANCLSLPLIRDEEVLGAAIVMRRRAGCCCLPSSALDAFYGVEGPCLSY